MIFDLCTEKALNAMNYLLFYQKQNLIFFIFEINGIKTLCFHKAARLQVSVRSL